jgi:Protein of unknwon function (DUF3310)
MSMIRPDYYSTESAYEPRKVIRAWGLGFDLGNVLKYIARAGKKPTASTIEDLEKAATYLRLYIEDLKAERPSSAKETQ